METKQKEPFLKHKEVAFRQDFLLFDNSMNESVQYFYHLRIPKTKITDPIMNQTAPSVAPLNNIGQVLRPSIPKAEPNGRRGMLQKTIVENAAKLTQNEVEIPQNIEKIPEKPNEDIKQRPQARIVREVVPPRSLSDYWIKHIDNGESVKFLFSYMQKGSPSYVYKEHPSGNTLLTATMDMKTNCISINQNEETIALIRYDSQNQIWFSGTVTQKVNQEICALVFNTSFTEEGQPKLFDIIVPSIHKLKATNGTELFVIPFEQTSILNMKSSAHLREVVSLKTRMPPNEGNSFDYTFSGKFKEANRNNFILYHEKSPDRHLFTFEINNNGDYVISCGYPFTPLQGFIISICSTLK